MFSCQVRDGAYRFIGEGSCVWAAAGGRYYQNDGSSGSMDVTDRSGALAAGVQFKTQNDFVFGFAAGYEHGKTDSFTTELDRDQFNAGIVGKRVWQAFELAGAVTGGGGTIHSDRSVLGLTASADRDFYYVAGTGRATYLHEMGSMYIKPIAEGSLTYISASGYTESGAGIFNLTVGDTDQFVGRGSGMIEVGTELGSADSVLIRPYIGAGVTVLAGEDIQVTSSFAAFSGSTVSLTTDVDNIYGDVKAGVSVLGKKGWTGRIEYDGHFSGNTQSHSGTAKVSIPF